MHNPGFKGFSPPPTFNRTPPHPTAFVQRTRESRLSLDFRRQGLRAADDSWLSKMRSATNRFWQPVGIICFVVAFYLADCLIAHQLHPAVPWLESGVYNCGPFGILATAVCALAGLYCFVSKAVTTSKTVNKDFRKLFASSCSSKVSPCASVQLDSRGGPSPAKTNATLRPVRLTHTKKDESK